MNRSSVLAICTAALAEFPARSVGQGAPTIRLGTTPNESYALAIFAQEAGLFSRHGLNADIQYFTGGGAALAALIGGSLDFVCTNWGAVANAYVKSVPIAVVAPGALYSSRAPTTILATGKNAPYRKAADLNGKTVSITTLKDLQQAGVMKWSDANGGSSATIRFIELPLAEVPAALNAGRIDASLISEPNKSAAREEIRRLAAPYDAVAPRFMITNHAATSDYLYRNGEVAHRFAIAMKDAALWSNTHRGETAAIMGRIAKIPTPTLALMDRSEFAADLEAPIVQPVIDASVEYKFLEKSFPIQNTFWPELRKA